MKYKQMEFLQNKVGQEFEGVISGVIESGIFVELEESRAEGMISFRTMHGGFSMTAPFTAGSRTGEKYTIGQKVNVIIKKIDMSSRQMDLEIVESEESKEINRERKLKNSTQESNAVVQKSLSAKTKDRRK